MAVTVGELKWTTGMDVSGLERGIKKIEGGFDDIEKKANQMNSVMKYAGSAVGGYLSVSAVTQFGKAVMNVTAEFEKFNAVLTNTLGSNFLANSIMDQIQDFAAQTPFGVRELTDAFVKLANQGFVPTGRQMRQLGDLASSTGKSFDQLAEAILDAQTGEFERLKEFGIKARDAGDQVIFTFKGVATTVDKSSSAIRDYITALGDAQGVTGSMQSISKSLTGQISNLEDNWDNLLKTIGDGTNGVFKEAISTLSKMLTSATEYVEKINTINKYRLDEEVNPVTGRKTVSLPGSPITSSTNARAENIVQLSQGLKEQNDKFREGAKYIREYAAEFKRLNKERQLAVLGVKNKNFASAIDKEYRDMMGTVKAQAEQIIKDRAKPKDANFGGSTKTGKSEEEKRAERIRDAYKKLSSELDLLDLDKKLSFKDLNESKISAYEDLLRSLIENGFRKTDKAVVDVTDKIFKLNVELNKIEGNKFAVDQMSREFENAAKAAAKAEEQFKKTVAQLEDSVDPETFQKLTSPPDLKNSQKTVDAVNKISDAAYDVYVAFDSWSQALEGVDDGLSYTLGQIGQLAAGVSQMAQGVAMGIATGNPIQIASAALTFGAQLFSMGKKVKQMNAAARAEVQKFYNDAKRGELEYQALLRKRSLDSAKQGKSSYQSIISQLDELKKQTPEIQAAYNKIFNSLQGGQFAQGKDSKHGTWFRKAKTWDIMASLAGSDYDRLLQLDTQGKLKGKEKEDFEDLKKLREELDKAGISASELGRQLDEMVTGTNLDSLSTMLADLFKNGKDAAKDFGKSFEQIVGQAVLNSFKFSVIEKQLEPLLDYLTNITKGAKIPTSDEIKAAVEMSKDIAGKIAGDWTAVQSILDEAGLGSALSGAAGNEQGLTSNKVSRQLTEETGSELAGLWRGMYDIGKKQYETLVKMDLNLVRTADTATQTLDRLNKIEQNTASTVTRLDDAITELKAINKNTGGQSARDMGV